MSRWRDTKPENIIWAELLDGRRVRFSELRPGDVFRGWWNGEHIDPTTHMANNSYFKAMESGRKADGLDTTQDFGYVLTVEKVKLKKVLN